MKRNRFVVFCSSSDAVDGVHLDAAAELGRLIGEREGTLVYGGTAMGLMQRVAQGTRHAGGRVIGVIPRFMAEKGIGNPDDHEQVVVEDMRTRKGEMERLGEAFIALPGGIGTLEELFEALVLLQLRRHAKPVVLVNTQGFYTNLVRFLGELCEQHFMKPETLRLLSVVDSPAQAIAAVDDYTPQNVPEKWMDRR